MRWPVIVAATALGAGLTACDKIPFLSQDEAGTPGQPAETSPVAAAPGTTAAGPDTAPAAGAGDTSTPSSAPPTGQPAAGTPRQPPAPPPRAPQPVRRVADEPWFPTDTGTVRPGMSREDVIAVWGPPIMERSAGSWTYLYFRNGCEISCGTHDIVFLQGGQVVDAIVRGPGHVYAGTSSSPEGVPAEFTPPVREPEGNG